MSGVEFNLREVLAENFILVILFTIGFILICIGMIIYLNYKGKNVNFRVNSKYREEFVETFNKYSKSTRFVNFNRLFFYNYYWRQYQIVRDIQERDD